MSAAWLTPNSRSDPDADEAEADGITSDRVVEELLKQVAVA